MNDGLDIPEVDFLETAAFAFLVFDGKSLQLLRANRCAELWYVLSGLRFSRIYFRINVARSAQACSGKSFRPLSRATERLQFHLSLSLRFYAL